MSRRQRTKKARQRPSREEAEAAVKTLLEWIGDDAEREGLRGTPARVVRAYEDWFSGYSDDPVEFLRRTFHEVDGYDEMAQYMHLRERRVCLEALAGLSAQGARGIITSRPNYFSETEELQLFELLYRDIEFISPTSRSSSR